MIFCIELDKAIKDGMDETSDSTLEKAITTAKDEISSRET